MIHIWKPSPSGSTRTLLLLHGTGGDEHSLLALAEALDEGAALLSIRGNVREGTANRFFRRLAEGVFDLEDLKQRTEELGNFVKSASDSYGFTMGDLTAVGFSNGANMAASLLLSRPEVLGRAMLVRSMVPFEPIDPPNLIDKHVLMLTGEHDPIVPVANAQQLASMLARYGSQVTFELLDAGHDFTRRDLELGREWLHT